MMNGYTNTVWGMRKRMPGGLSKWANTNKGKKHDHHSGEGVWA